MRRVMSVQAVDVLVRDPIWLILSFEARIYAFQVAPIAPGVV